MGAPRRRLGLAWALAILALAAIAFQHRQNVQGGIGGPISLPKLLWLSYALAAWYVVPFFFWRSPLLPASVRRVYGLHLASFTLRAVVEAYLIFVAVAWIPPYGIAHDAFGILLITVASGRPGPARSEAEAAGRRFLTSIRVALGCEIVFAWLFHRQADARAGIYFASDDPSWWLVNGLTVAVLLVAWPDLGRTLWAGRNALFPADTRHALPHPEASRA